MRISLFADYVLWMAHPDAVTIEHEIELLRSLSISQPFGVEAGFSLRDWVDESARDVLHACYLATVRRQVRGAELPSRPLRNRRVLLR